VVRRNPLVYGLVILAISVLACHPNIVLQEDIANNQEPIKKDSLANDVIINSDHDWIIQGWPGNGTEKSPYVIEGIQENNVKISNSTKWFVIQNSLVHEIIQFANVTNGKVEFTRFQKLSAYLSMNISISNNVQDVVNLAIDSCNHIIIANNSMIGASVRYDGGIGIAISLSQDLEILNNTVQEFYTGIEIENSSDCHIEGNQIAWCGIYVAVTVTPPPVPLGVRAFIPSQSQFDIIEGEGVRLWNCTSSTIVDNTIEENYGGGIVLTQCSVTLFYHNSLSLNHKGMVLEDCTSFNITSNLIDHGLILRSTLAGIVMHNRFFMEGISLEGNLECLLHSISNNTADEQSIIYLANVNSYSLASQTAAQVILVNCTQVSIQDVVTTFDYGIQVLFSEGCRFRYIVGGYFLIRGSHDIELEDSNIYGWAGYTIVIDSSRSIQIVGNYLSCGILVQNFSSEVFVRNNSQIGVRTSAIRVESDSSNVFIEGNVIRESGRSTSQFWFYSYFPAIIVLGSDCNITDNTIVENYGMGISLYGTNITVCYNIIARNGQGNALDNGSDNLWDDGISRGNEWGDYVGFGYYYIPGGAGSVDRYPSASSEFLEPSVFIFWAVILGTPMMSVILIGLIVFLRRRDRAVAGRPVQSKRVGLG
jgi:parallel beta-helix repeat protein